MNILLVQLGAMGDCLLVSTLTKQIKIDYPKCQLTWLILEKYKPVAENNPYVDEICTINEDGIVYARTQFNKYVEDLIKSGKNFDKIIVTDNTKENKKIWFGPLHSMYHRVYQELTGNKLTISTEPLIFLTDDEVNKVNEFVKNNELDDENLYPILFECGPKSGQSTLNLEKAYEISDKMTEKYPHLRIILSSKEKLTNTNKKIIDGSELTYRENAELINHCKLLIGCSSGISWLNTSNWSKKIPTIQYIKEYDDYVPTFSASMLLDFSVLGLNTDNLIELYCKEGDNEFINCLDNIFGKSFEDAKKNYPLKKVCYSEALGKMYLAKSKEDEQIPINKVQISKKKGYLLGKIPITLKIKNYYDKIKFYLCGIPILKIKKQEEK